MSSSTVGMFKPCDLDFGCWTLGDGVTFGKWPIFGKLFTFRTPFGRGALFTWTCGGWEEDEEVDGEAVKGAATTERSPWLETTLPFEVFSPRLLLQGDFRVMELGAFER